MRGCPRGAAVSGEGDEDVRVAKIKVVPGNIHSPEERRTGVVIGPARFPVVATVGVSAEMGPAWVRGSGGLIPAQALTTQAPSSHTVTQLVDGLWYRTTGSPKVLSKGL